MRARRREGGQGEGEGRSVGMCASLGSPRVVVFGHGGRVPGLVCVVDVRAGVRGWGSGVRGLGKGQGLGRRCTQ